MEKRNNNCVVRTFSSQDECRRIPVESTEGDHLVMPDGTRLLDFVERLSCVNARQRNEQVTTKVKEALDRDAGAEPWGTPAARTCRTGGRTSSTACPGRRTTTWTRRRGQAPEERMSPILGDRIEHDLLWARVSPPTPTAPSTRCELARTPHHRDRHRHLPRHGQRARVREARRGCGWSRPRPAGRRHGNSQQQGLQRHPLGWTARPVHGRRHPRWCRHLRQPQRQRGHRQPRPGAPPPPTTSTRQRCRSLCSGRQNVFSTGWR